MDIYHKWKQLLSDTDKLNEWIEFYERNDPTLAAVMDFCKHECQELREEQFLKLAIIALLDAKVKTFTERAKMAHYMSRPLPTELKMGQKSYPEDIVDFGSVPSLHEGISHENNQS